MSLKLLNKLKEIQLPR